MAKKTKKNIDFACLSLRLARILLSLSPPHFLAVFSPLPFPIIFEEKNRGARRGRRWEWCFGCVERWGRKRVEVECGNQAQIRFRISLPSFFFSDRKKYLINIVKFVAQETTRPDNTQHTKNSQNHYNA